MWRTGAAGGGMGNEATDEREAAILVDGTSFRRKAAARKAMMPQQAASEPGLKTLHSTTSVSAADVKGVDARPKQEDGV